MKLQPKQRELIRLLNTYDNVLAYGGARSGKTYCTCQWMAVTGYRNEGSRQLIARRYATDIRHSVWDDTIPTVLRGLDMVAGSDYRAYESDMEIHFSNGAVIVCAGLDDKERVDKILGQEFLTMYINESQDVPWPTVKTLRTRLSQRIDGVPTRFIADLNPTSIAHWTYKQWFEGKDPETGKPLAGSFGAIQINPYDNRENLADGYIERELETLTGDFRSRFLLGEYSSNSELVVFHPRSFSTWDDFLAWGRDKWASVRLVGGLDLGVDDPDAFVILAYVDGDPDVWIVYEHMARRQSTEELAAQIKRGIEWVTKNVPTPEPAFQIWSDTNTVRHGKEGDSKKNARMLSEIYGLPTRPAYKRDKILGIEFLRDDVNSGRIHIPQGGPFADETSKTVWTKNPIDESIIRDIDDETFHPNMMDAIVYAYRFLMSYGNSAMIGRASLSAKESEPLGYTERMHEALNQPGKYW
jgi:phage terminase large subunit